MSIVIWTAVVTALLTLFTNIFFHFLKNKFDWLENKKSFKRDHSYKCLTELYLDLYGIVAQSEYTRAFYSEIQGREYSAEEFPFFETIINEESYKKMKEMKGNIDVEIPKKDSKSQFEAIASFNKSFIDKKIIENSKFASQDLLKLACAHRFTEAFYIKDLSDPNIQNHLQDEELHQIYKIVRLIVQETNQLLRFCNMPYDKNEIKSGQLNINK